MYMYISIYIYTLKLYLKTRVIFPSSCKGGLQIPEKPAAKEPELPPVPAPRLVSGLGV